MKTYVLTLAKVFPKNHIKSGMQTNFRSKFFYGIGRGYCYADRETEKHKKIHTIRANYELWRKRFEEIAAGRAILSVRQWSGKPYQSPQIPIWNFDNTDGIGLQRLKIAGITTHHAIYIDGHSVDTKELANNDGLEESDWHAWFKGYDLTEPMAVIHFTSFRY